MAKFYAITEADIVGSSTDFYPFYSNGGPVPTATDAIFLQYTTTYDVFTTDTPISVTSNVKSWTKYKSSTPFAVGAGEVQHVWKADPGDSFNYVQTITPLATLGTPGFTASTEQEINQLFFKFDDSIHGSDEDDMLCGWAGNDSMWGNDGSDEFYYGEGMEKDKIMDLDKKKDEIILDTDLVKNFKKLTNDVKLKNDKIVLKFDSSDKLIVYGIDTLKDLKKVVSFDDFTDFA